MKSLNFFWCVEVMVIHMAVMGCSAARCCFLQTVHKNMQNLSMGFTKQTMLGRFTIQQQFALAVA